MPDLELLYEHHGVYFWLGGTLLSLMVGSFSRVRAFLATLPHGLQRAIRYQREASVRRLEGYANDRTKIFRLLLGQACINLLLTSWWATHAANKLFFEVPIDGNSLSKLVSQLFNEIGAIYIILIGVVQALAWNAGLALFTLWEYRDPTEQARRLREKLAVSTDTQ